MSRLEELIKELCPEGVEYVSIGDVVSYEQPTKYIVKSTNYSDEFTIPVLTAGQSFILGYTDEGNGVYEASKDNPVIIFDDFTGAFKWVDFPFKVKSSAMKILHANESRTILRYIYHVMSSLNFSSNEHKRLWIGIYSHFNIPLPPLEVQREIVRILDNFTELTEKCTEELTEELTERKQQYEYYRNELLTESKSNTAKYYTLDQLFTRRNGYTPSKKNREYWENGTIPWFRMEDIRENGHILSKAMQSVSHDAVKGEVFPKNSIIVSTSATIGEHALITVPSLANQRFTYLMLKDEYKGKINIKYIYYYCFKLDEYCKGCLNQGNFASVDMKKFDKFEFVIPPIEEQRKIVQILDCFNNLYSEFSSEISAEINALQKQYEYYRDKLLTFKRKTA